jgi:pimeloyl-ACP methyl ester carboxylesterase
MRSKKSRPARTLFLVVALALCFAACQGSPPAEDAAPPPPAVPTGLTAGAHVFTATDGSTMPYEVTGAGEATVVLVHCWMCDRSYWSAQVPVLAERYRTIALDLPGHGEASAGRAVWSIAGFGEDVAALLRELDLQNVVLVGHSMGGPVSLRAAGLSTGRVRGIVAVDTLHDAEVDLGSALESMLPPFEADYAGTCKGFMDAMFPEEGVAAIQATVTEKGCAPERGAVGVALMKDFGNIDMEGWFREAGVPIRAINASANPTQVETNRKYADFDVVVMEGVGHFPQMTRPEQFNPLLLAAIEQLLAPAPAAAGG